MMTSTESPTDSPFRIERSDDAGSGVVVRLEGKFGFRNSAEIWKGIRTSTQPTSTKSLHFDLSKVESMDGSISALVMQTKWDITASGGTCEIVGATGSVEKILQLYEEDPAKAAKDRKAKQKPIGLLGQIGNATYKIVLETQLVLAFIGSMVIAFLGILRRPGTANWREVPAIMNRTGADAVPIVLLINFLMGFVMGFQSAVQLKQFGANIFVADLVGLSITRELGPLMTAIIVSGRSGAAFAAELGTMKVSEEVDALRTMGFDPLRFLVFPRLLGLILIAPILTLIGDFIGLFGGLIVGIVSLDLTVTAYLNETQGALAIWDVVQGLVKGGIFATAIGLVACQQGLATSGGAEGVGQRTTSSVVSALFALILIDAAFTMVFHALGM